MWILEIVVECEKSGGDNKWLERIEMLIEDDGLVGVFKGVVVAEYFQWRVVVDIGYIDRLLRKGADCWLGAAEVTNWQVGNNSTIHDQY